MSNYMTKYLLNNVYKFLTPVKYITENDMKIQNYQLNIQIKNQTYEIEQMKNEIKNTEININELFKTRIKRINARY